MNTKNILIAALAIAVGVLSTLLYRAHTAASTPTSGDTDLVSKKSIGIDDKTAKALCATKLSDADGGEMSIDQANAATHYFDSIYPGEEVKAYHMGLATIERMLDSARAYNNQSGTFDHIIGFRFHRAITTRTFGQTLVHNKYDLVIVPTLESDADLSTVRTKSPAARSVPVFSYLRPCPKLCSNKLPIH